jgi:5-hydroxyisourate hydrolase
MAGKLSTHVLDTIHGCPAAGVKIEVWFLEGDTRKLLKTAVTGQDGRTATPLLSGEEIKSGSYELLFFVSDYFASKGAPLPKQPFLEQVPVRFGIDDPMAGYHVPLLCSPWSYTTYRGS